MSLKLFLLNMAGKKHTASSMPTVRNAQAQRESDFSYYSNIAEIELGPRFRGDPKARKGQTVILPEARRDVRL